MLSNVVLQSWKLIYLGINVNIIKSDVDLLRWMFHDNFNFWPRWYAICIKVLKTCLHFPVRQRENDEKNVNNHDGSIKCERKFIRELESPRKGVEPGTIHVDFIA